MTHLNDKTKLIADKHVLWGLIKRLGNYYDEDKEFIQNYGIDVYSAFMEDLGKAIDCFSKLIAQYELIKTLI